MPAPVSLTRRGALTAEVRDRDTAAMRPFEGDTDPSPLFGNLLGSLRYQSRIATPAVRREWWEWLGDGPGPTTRGGGGGEFVSVTWGELTELPADEFRRIIDAHGIEAIFGGSNGRSSVGRFHHAQSQVHRLLNFCGGYTFSRHYILGAAGTR